MSSLQKSENDGHGNNGNSQRTAYKGFIAGIFSGMSKLIVGHPFDTIKVRMQTTTAAQYAGPLDCLVKTVRREGPLALYKGATPPLVGWMFMDSVMLGSLGIYRGFLLDHNLFFRCDEPPIKDQLALLHDIVPSIVPPSKLTPTGHGIAGIMAGWTVSVVAAPFEHIKARLQIQQGTPSALLANKNLYRGPIDCTASILRNHGIWGLYRGLPATMLFRSFFFAWWSSYDIFSRALRTHTTLLEPAVNFWAGGLSAQVFWIFSYPSDVVKQRIMTDGFGADRKYRNWWEAARQIHRDNRGWRGYWRGFVPCFLRAFPANATALLAYEAVMRMMGEGKRVDIQK